MVRNELVEGCRWLEKEMRSSQPGLLCPSTQSGQGLCHGLLSGVRALAFLQLSADHPSPWGSQSPAVSLCQAG